MIESLFSLPGAIALFLLGAAVIAVAGTRLSAAADRLADRTGLGEAVTGAVLLGAATSLSGIAASVTAAVDGLPTLALSNAIGGIAAQTVFLAFADIAYRRANLEHAAASAPNMMQASLLIVLLALMLCAMILPPIAILGVHPVTPILVVAYVYGLHLVHRSRDEPMWRPRMTGETRVDKPDEPQGGQAAVRVAAEFALAGIVVLAAGIAVARSGGVIAAQTGISESVVGALLVAVATSLPELVTSVAAVRRGALTLAVAGVIGGNAFDTLFAAVADGFYRAGSLYHSVTSHEMFLIALTILMTAVLLLGLIRRERSGPGGIGFESCLVLVLYVLAMGVISTG
ncbi:MAG: sodium:calcium antiporter [Halofilum sp. (in: g-proteobacteria)]